MLGQVFSFLSQLIAELSPPTLPAATEPEATTEDTGSSANVSFSLKLRIFSSIMASFSVTAPESAPADLEVAGTELLNDTVETMAAASEAEIEEQV